MISSRIFRHVARSPAGLLCRSFAGTAFPRSPAPKAPQAQSYPTPITDDPDSMQFEPDSADPYITNALREMNVQFPQVMKYGKIRIPQQGDLQKLITARFVPWQHVIKGTEILHLHTPHARARAVSRLAYYRDLKERYPLWVQIYAYQANAVIVRSFSKKRIRNLIYGEMKKRGISIHGFDRAALGRTVYDPKKVKTPDEIRKVLMEGAEKRKERNRGKAPGDPPAGQEKIPRLTGTLAVYVYNAQKLLKADPEQLKKVAVAIVDAMEDGSARSPEASAKVIQMRHQDRKKMHKKSRTNGTSGRSKVTRRE